MARPASDKTIPRACSKCLEVKLPDSYRGNTNICTACYRERYRRWVLANREHVRRYALDYGRTDRYKAQQKAWKQIPEVRDAIRARVRKAQATDDYKARHAVALAKYKASPRGAAKRANNHHSRRRAVKAASVSTAELEAMLSEAIKCGYCKRTFGGPVKKTIDHVRPISKGGAHEISNLMICCLNCNASKNDRDLEAWLEIAWFRKKTNSGEHSPVAAQIFS